jgi:Right handed beta helix region
MLRWIATVWLIGFCSWSRGADFYVSPQGRDDWSGKFTEPNIRKSDGPFATLSRARDAVRAVRRGDAVRDRPVVVQVRAGTYFLDQPLTFEPADSGTQESPTVFEAYKDETPLISGGAPVTGWKVGPDGRWTTNLPRVQSGAWDLTQLFVNGQRRYRPRLPERGYFFIDEALPPMSKNAGKGFDGFIYPAGSIRSDWANLGDVEVLGFQIWTMARLRIESVDDSRRAVRFTGTTRHMEPWSALAKGRRFLVENVKEALSRPGQWYLDRKSGELTYLPMPGEQPDKTPVIAPRLSQLVIIRGNPANRQWVSNLNLRGLTFSHTNWVTPPEGNNFSQAEVNLGAAISAIGARDCLIERCRIASVGIYGIELGEACRNNRIAMCELTDLAAGGVKIGLMRLESDEELLTSHNIVEDCLIAHGGRMHPAAIGVWIGHSPHNIIRHNQIADFYYTGISVGWSWGYGPSGAHHNLIEYNHVHDIGQGVLSDMGGIYTLGVAPGSIIRHNLFHDIESYDYGGWGIYFDEGTTGMLAEQNVVYNTRTGGFHQHYGRDNQVRYNVFANSKLDQIQRTRMEPHLSFTFEQNIVYWNQGNLLGSNWKDDKFKLDRNLYWRTDGKPISFAGLSLKEWQDKGQDHRSLIEDPMFIDPAAGNYRLKENSPAGKIKFKPMDWDKAGRRVGGKSAPVPSAFPVR